MTQSKRRISLLLLGTLIIVLGLFSYRFFQQRGDSHLLTVAFLNIGQGDAIYIEAPNGNQVIVDGGPDDTLLTELGNVIPFYDRSINMLVVTNPDRDHYDGFIDLLKHYSVGTVLEPGTHSATPTYATFERTIKEQKVPELVAHRGMSFVLDKEDDVHLDILFPDRDVSTWKSNDGSIIAKLVYGDTSVMLTGDATVKTENIVLQDYTKEALHSTILKVGHHGSKTSSSEQFLKAVAPMEAVISAGYHNSYGLPKQEILDRLSALKIPTLITYKEGTIILQSDGKRFWRKK
jgi:competence protein ComEC